MKCINGRFYTTEGLVEDEGRLKKQIYDELYSQYNAWLATR